MYSPVEIAIIKTLCYDDVFVYPLTCDEIKKRLIGYSVGRDEIKSALKKMQLVSFRNGFYFLKGKSHFVHLRSSRRKWATGKLKVAKKTARILRFLPNVRLIGVSGGLAIDNTDKYDDIDLFIITSKNTLWTTRLLVTLLIHMIGMRRRPKERETNDKICLNMFIDENHLSMPKNERDVFLAHELVQLKTIYERGRTYQKLLVENKWATKYLPNAFKINKEHPKYKKSNTTFAYKNTLIDNILKNLQLRYMKARRTDEVIGDGIIRFHPKDARTWVLRKYRERLKQYGLSP